MRALRYGVLVDVRAEIRARVRVDSRTGCWVWKLGTNGHYGMFTIDGKCTTAHKIAFQAFRGSVPKGAEVCHSCDNTRCVNPNHLWLGSHRGNMLDASRKGRIRNGERTPEWFAAKRKAARTRWAKQ